MRLLEALQVDDVVGAVPAHLFAGVWGTLAASIAAGGHFVFGLSWLVWMALAKTVGVRVSDRVEQLGQDVAELGLEAYPEFVLMPEMDDES